ncbi:DUF6383 domain-containing protein [Parabacteroides chinchillae]
MNKKFFTLLAITLMAGGLSVSAQYAPGSEIAAKLAPADKYYHIKNGSSYLAADKRDGKDSIKVMTVAAGNFTEPLSLDSAMWKLSVEVQKTTGDSVFTFENKATGATLNLPAKEGNAIVTDKDPITEWSWKTTANGSIQAKIGSDVYSLQLTGFTPADYLVKVQKGTPSTKWAITEVANIKLTAEKLNNQNDGYFKLAFGNDLSDNVFTKYKIKAVKVTANDSIMLQVIDAKKDTKFTTDTVFVVVDTIKYDIKGAAEWKSAAGFKFTLDTLGRAVPGRPVYGTTAFDTIAADGRSLGSYLFVIELNTGRITGDSLIVKSNTIEGESKVSWGYLGNAGTKVLTTSPVANIDALPYITLDFGTKADIDVTKSYYVQVVKGADKDNNNKYWTALLTGSTIQYSGEISDLIPATQWSVKKDGAGRYQFINRDNKNTTNTNAFVYALDGNYIMQNGDTVKLTAIKDEVKADKYLGYKHFTADELANLSVKLQVVTPLGSSAYVYVASGDSAVNAKDMEEADAMKFKLVSANGATDSKFGADDLQRSAYLLKEQFGDQRVLGYNWHASSANDPKTFRMMKTNQTVDQDSVAVFFRATKNAGEYELIMANVNTTAPVKYDDLTTSKDSVVSFASAGVMVPVKYGSTVAGYFKIVTPAAPDYVNVTKNSSAHMQFTSTENTSLMIGMNDKFEPVLKSESELDAAYSLFVDTAKVTDPKKPLFYLMTTAGLELKSETSGDVMANYLNVNKDGKLEFILAKQYGLAKDTLLVYNRKDLNAKPESVKMSDNKAVFAFRATPTDGEMLIEAANGQCMKQDNGKLVLVAAENALPFTTKVVDTPTGNESTEANTISVVAGEGNVTVYGAAGKEVIVSNVLGQKTTIVATSDSEVIAAPQGVVIVAVEGEAAVKAVVK